MSTPVHGPGSTDPADYSPSEKPNAAASSSDTGRPTQSPTSGPLGELRSMSATPRVAQSRPQSPRPVTGGALLAKVRGGASAQQVIDQHGITDPDLIQSLKDVESDVMGGRLHAEVRGGASAQQLIDQHGVTDPGLIRSLKNVEQNRIGDGLRAEVSGGASAQQVIDQHGITDPDLIQSLQNVEQNRRR